MYCIGGTSHSERVIMKSGSQRKLCKVSAVIETGCCVMVTVCMLTACTPKNSMALVVDEVEISSEQASVNDAAAKETCTETGEVFVHICGAVKHPGVYALDRNGHVCDAVSAAGGFDDGASRDYVNQAYPLSDGIKIVIPTASEAEELDETVQAGPLQKGITPDTKGSGDIGIAGPGQGNAESSDVRVNINTADETQLCTIPGIGKTRAADIIAYRDAHGGFKKVEDIKNVAGIKEGTFTKIKDHIRVD